MASGVAILQSDQLEVNAMQHARAQDANSRPSLLQWHLLMPYNRSSDKPERHARTAPPCITEGKLSRRSRHQILNV